VIRVVESAQAPLLDTDRDAFVIELLERAFFGNGKRLKRAQELWWAGKIAEEKPPNK
jgi:hypothetical protein